MIGHPLWLDAQTNNWGRSEYARVCVRMDLSKCLPTGVWIQGKSGRFFQPVEYEGIGLLCFQCGLVGHKIGDCPSLAKDPKLFFSRRPDLPPSSAPPHPSAPTPSPPAPTTCPTPPTITPTPPPSTSTHPPPPHPGAGILPTPPPSALHGHLSEPPPASDEPGYGPWILVTRKQNRTRKPPSSSPPLTHRPPPAPPKPRPTPTPPPQRTWVPKEPTPSQTIIPPATSSMEVDLGGDQPVPPPPSSSATPPLPQPSSSSPAEDSMAIVVASPTPPRDRTGAGRVSKTFVDKELKNLGPIEFVSRKRRIITKTSYDGGDASPLVD